MRSRAAVVVVAMGAIASCQGIQERVDVMRAKKIEIIGDDDKTKMDVEAELRALRERVATLEAQLDAGREGGPGKAAPH